MHDGHIIELSVVNLLTLVCVSCYVVVVAAILDLIKNLLRDDVPKEQNLFRFVQQK
jgi:hypothetical protein